VLGDLSNRFAVATNSLLIWSLISLIQSYPLCRHVLDLQPREIEWFADGFAFVFVRDPPIYA
jgi:hypothetical protein